MPNFTKSAIKASFLKLLNEQPLSKISVRDIVEDCGINRNSFYYHYHNIPSLIEEISKDTVNELIKKYPSINSLSECVNVAIEYLRKNKKPILHIYNSVNRDIYEKEIMRLCDYTARTYFSTVFAGEDIFEYDKELIISVFKCTLYGLSFEWLSSGMQMDISARSQRMAELFRGLFEELVKRSRSLPKIDIQNK
ncbi:MAG: TetR/AcrR family transcriptional regulator [Eubacteriales bacterium]